MNSIYTKIVSVCLCAGLIAAPAAEITAAAVNSSSATTTTVSATKAAIAKVVFTGYTYTAPNVKLSWEKISDFTGVEIYYRESTATKWIDAGTGNFTDFTIINLTAGKNYVAKARAFKTVDGLTTYGEYSDNYNFTTATSDDTTAPAQVTLGGYTCTSNTATIKWSKVSGAQGYAVYYRKSGTTDWTRVASTTAASYTIKNLSAATAYNYRVRAYKTVNSKTIYGKYSATKTFTTVKTTTAPAQVVFTGYKYTAPNVKLSWKKISDFTGIDIYYRLSTAKSWIKAGTGNFTDFTIVNLKAGKTYVAKARAYKTVNGKKIYGKYSSEYSFKAAAAAVDTSAPAKVTLSGYSCTSATATVKWSKVSGAQGYAVYYRKSGTTDWTRVASTTATSYTIKNLTPAKTYNYRVRAYKTVNGKTIYGKYSDTKSFTTLKAVASKFGINKAYTSTKNSIAMTWTRATGTTVSGAEFWFRLYGTKKWYKAGVSTANDFNLVGLAAGQKYQIVARTYSTVNGKKTYSKYTPIFYAATVPDSITIKSTSRDSDALKISWKKQVCSRYDISIYKGTKLIKSTDVDSKILTYKFTGLEKDTIYTIKIRAKKYDGTNFIKGAYTSVNAQTKHLKAPSNMKYTATTDTISLSWTDLNGSDKFEVYIYDTTTKAYVLKATTTDAECTLTNLTPNTSYSVYIVSYLIENSTLYTAQNAPKAVSTTK